MKSVSKKHGMQKHRYLFIRNSLLLLFLLSSSCVERAKDGKATAHSAMSIISLAIDNEDEGRIGYERLENDVVIGVTSLCVTDHFAFLTDEFHKNVKRVDLRSSEVTHSKKLTEATFFKQFNEAVWFNDRIYIPSSQRDVFILSTDLKEYTSFQLPTKGGYPIDVFDKTDSTLDFVVEIRDSLYRVDRVNNVILRRGLTNSERNLVPNIFNLEQGNLGYKRLKYIKTDSVEYLVLDNGRVNLERPFKYSPDARNVDFNEDYCVIFEIEGSFLRLYVYKINPVKN